MSGSRRSEICSFGASSFGRPPRRTTLSPCISTPLAKSSSVSSGASSGSVQLLSVDRLFSVIGLPHRYHVPSVAPRRPDEHHHPTAQESDSDEAPLAVVVPRVLEHEDRSGKHLGSLVEVEPTPGEGPVPLGGVESD